MIVLVVGFVIRVVLRISAAISGARNELAAEIIHEWNERHSG